jgi:hypothetical protein
VLTDNTFPCNFSRVEVSLLGEPCQSEISIQTCARISRFNFNSVFGSDRAIFFGKQKIAFCDRRRCSGAGIRFERNQADDSGFQRGPIEGDSAGDAVRILTHDHLHSNTQNFSINTASIEPVCAERGWLPDHVFGWLRPQQENLHCLIGCSANRRLISDELLILKSLRLTEQLFVIGRSPAFGANVSRVCDKQFVKLEVGLQLFLHFAKRFGHLKSIPNN